MPAVLNIRGVNIKAIEDAYKKDITEIQVQMKREALKLAKRMERDIRNLVKVDLLSHGYQGIESILDGIQVKEYTGRGNKIYVRVRVSLTGLAKIHLGQHRERFHHSGKSTGTLKPSRLNLDAYLDREAPKLQALTERITAKILDS